MTQEHNTPDGASDRRTQPSSSDSGRSPSRWWRRRRPAQVRGRSLRLQRRDTHITPAQSPQGVGIDAQVPDSMPRAEDDVATRANSPEFHDRPGSGRNTDTRQFYF